MEIRHREFTGEIDIKAMITLAQACPYDNLHVIDLPYRLSSWALDDPENTGLWVDKDGQLRAWAVLQAPFWTLDYAYHPGAVQTLHRQLLAWVDQRSRLALGTASGRPCWFAMVFANQTDRIRILEEAGFASQAEVGQDSWSKVLMQRSARYPVAESALPPGFSIRPLAGENEVASYVHLHRAVFKSANMTPEWRARVLRRPEYRADLDLVAVAPDGSLAAFCVCWLDQRFGTRPAGQIEPLGVHEDFRKLGVGRSILSEGLRRLTLSGAESVLVETDRQRNAALELYTALGFRVLRDVLVYRKDYGSAPD